MSGTGSGPTPLAAFDAALLEAGVANFNLVRLSSVIPPGSIVTTPDVAVPPSGAWGDRLYVVLADARSAVLGDRLAAGIGWVQDAETGKGLFVEHEGHSADEVETHIADSLQALMAARSVDFGEGHMRLSTTVCESSAACALVVAVFESTPWVSEDRSA
ncbi:MAG: pyruvoyl-dependent arginine decarboxylase [Acidimicrobiia bacterium]|nr:pyruvoyl-dependent arginine decarboxylase [Acidimicrobiia bacterium]